MPKHARPNPRPDHVPKPKRDIPDEERERLRNLALERVAAGKLGGSKFGKMGGRPSKRKARAAQRVAEAAQEEEEAKHIIDVFKRAIDPSQPMSIQLKGAGMWLDIEREETKLALQEETADAEQMTREQLIDILHEKLTAGPAAEVLRAVQLPPGDDEDVIDGELVEE